MPSAHSQPHIPKPKCLQKDHQDEPLDYICINADCSKNPLICYFCLKQKHLDHQNILMKVFLSKLLSLNSSTSQQIVPLSSEIDNHFETIKKFLHTHQNQLQNFELILHTFNQYRQINITDSLNFFNIISKLNEIQGCSSEDFRKKVNKFIKDYYFKYFATIESNDWKNIDITKHLLQQRSESILDIVKSLEKLHQTARFKDPDVLNLFPLRIEIQKKVKVYFTPEMAPPHMEIISPTQAQMKTSGSKRLLVLQPCLTKNQSVKKWSVKIIKLASWIGVGVCHKNKICSVDFDFQYSNAGHGNYMISSNGYSWSSYKMEFNSKFQSFSYTSGDLIHVQFDPKERKVKFKQDSTEKTYEIEVEITDDPIYPEINLTGVGDEVEILNH